MKNLAKVKELESLAKDADDKFKAFMTIPNIPHESVRTGKVSKITKLYPLGETLKVTSNSIPHYDIPWFDQMIDFPRGVKVTGAGFLLSRRNVSTCSCLINFFLEETSINGYEEAHSPIVAMPRVTATGQLPDKEGQMYLDQNEEIYLIPTAEVPVTNFTG